MPKVEWWQWVEQADDTPQSYLIPWCSRLYVFGTTTQVQLLAEVLHRSLLQIAKWVVRVDPVPPAGLPRTQGWLWGHCWFRAFKVWRQECTLCVLRVFPECGHGLAYCVAFSLGVVWQCVMWLQLAHTDDFHSPMTYTLSVETMQDANKHLAVIVIAETLSICSKQVQSGRRIPNVLDVYAM